MAARRRPDGLRSPVKGAGVLHRDARCTGSLQRSGNPKLAHHAGRLEGGGCRGRPKNRGSVPGADFVDELIPGRLARAGGLGGGAED
jgi:hypothetical protein